MAGLGVLFILVTGWGLVCWWRRRLETDRLWLRVAFLTMFLPYVANSAGWLVAELGRQPWVVYGLLRTEAGVSPNVGPATVWISLVGFTLIYAVLGGVGLVLMYRYGRPGSTSLAQQQDLAHVY
jgi:cytochrome d ubiquinol oxidase subunit I